MTNQQSFAYADRIDRDPYTSSQSRERALNTAIVQANISEGFEKYLEIFDAFYADDIEASSETGEESVRGKGGVRSLLFNFLVPLHVMAEVGGLLISFDRPRFLGMLRTRGILLGRSSWSVSPVGPAR
jgi:hypothetical protein